MFEPGEISHLEYTNVMLARNLIGLEDHYKEYHCSECFGKHLLALELYASECMPMEGGKELALCRRILEWATKAKTRTDYDALMMEARELRLLVQPGAHEHGEDHLTESSNCPSCQRKVAMDCIGSFNGPCLRLPDIQERVSSIIGDLSAKYGVSKPKIMFQENSEFCAGTSCTIMDAKNPERTTKIFLNPNQGNFSIRSVFHEWYHYLASVLGPAKIKERLGLDFAGDPDSEEEADRFAFKEMDSTPAISINRDERGNSSSMEPSAEGKVMRQELAYGGGGTSICGNLDALYVPFVPLAKLSARELNDAYSPEIIATALETGYAITMTQLGYIVANAATWLVEALIATYGPLGAFDRIFVTEMAAHHGARVITLANPGGLAAVSGQAKSMGDMIGQGRAFDAVAQLLQRPTAIQQPFRVAADTIQGWFGPLLKTPTSHKAVAGEQPFGGGGKHPPAFN